ncbi:trehalase family glycosidase [Asanoa sp. NPDC049573]|uniref:MGH1-like glycoside hydrolase domain-containing protein n=1 Tax=Asanoa sp. NPDC049573 TaxID=3155396 RepID=UPI0034234D2E
MSIPEPRGWNTWDVRFHTGWSHLPGGLRLRFALRDTGGTLFDGFTWRHGLVRLGHHTVEGAYAEVEVTAFDTRLRLEASGGTDELAVRATATGAAAAVLLIDEATGFGGEPVAVSPDGVVTHGAERWVLECSPAPVARDGSALVLAPDTLVSLRPAAAAAYDVAARIADAAAAAPRIHTAGWLGDSADAMTRALTWNTVYAPDLGRVLTPTSRDFVCQQREGFYGSWALHTWDTFFTGLVAAWVDPAYAEGIFAQILDQADPSGMLPNRVSDDKGRTDDRSQPPVGAYTVLKAYLGSGLSPRTRRTALLRGAYPALRDWHSWWLASRVGPHHLLAWGSDPVPGDTESATVDRARRESGLDDSPMYDDVALDPATHTMNLADVGLNALHVADAEALATIAAELGHEAAARAYAAHAASAAARIDALLWDPAGGRYRNRWADGAFSEHSSPTLLYPLLAGVPSPRRAQAVADALLASDALGGDPPLPSTARDDPGFSTRYWRGRVWAPMAFLAVEGIRRYGLDAHSRPIVDALLRLFLGEWTAHSHVRENYPVVPGEDVRPLAARSDGLMGWGGLLGYLAIQELADPRPDGWRFAHPGRDASVEGLALAEGRLSVRAGERLVVALDGRPLLDVPPGTVVTGYERDASGVRLRVSGEGGGIAVAVPDGRRDVTVRVGERTAAYPVGPDGLVRIAAHDVALEIR